MKKTVTCVIESGGLGLAQRVMCLDCVSMSHIEISLLPLTADTTHEPSLGCILTHRTPAPKPKKLISIFFHLAKSFEHTALSVHMAQVTYNFHCMRMGTATLLKYIIMRSEQIQKKKLFQNVDSGKKNYLQNKTSC